MAELRARTKQVVFAIGTGVVMVISVWHSITTLDLGVFPASGSFAPLPYLGI